MESYMINVIKQASSAKIQDYIKKTNELESITTLEIGESVGVSSAGLTMAECKALVGEMCVGKLRYVVVDHGELYEIGRVIDNVPVSVFYHKPQLKTAKHELGVAYTDAMYIALVTKAVRSYMALDEAKLGSYVSDTTMRRRGVIPYTYIQRKVTPYAAFKSSPDSTALLKHVLGLVCSQHDPVLCEISAEVAQNSFNTKAALYYYNTALLVA
jgi:hypothetical protein